MKKSLVVLSAFLLATASAGFASESGSGGGYGGGSATPGSEFEKPRGRGEEAIMGDEEENPKLEAENRKFNNESAAGAWSKDKEPGKDKPSDKD